MSLHSLRNQYNTSAMVTIRLARRGARKCPFYDIVVTDSRKPRDSGYIERLGYYNPIARGNEVPLSMDQERIDYWLQKGCKTSERVGSLIKRFRKQGDQVS